MPADLDPDQLDTWDGDSFDAFERIMPRDEGDRRRALERSAFVRKAQPEPDADAGEETPPSSDNGLRQGRVIEIASALCRVDIGDETLLCTVRGILHAQETGFTNAAAVGDQVYIRRDGADHGVVEQVLPRRSLLARPDVFHPHLQQVVVANADHLLIVASWREPIIWFELIDRYLIAAARNRLPALLCVNKIDLAASRAECERDVQPYRALGIPCLFTSAQTGDGIDDLRAVLQGRTTVLAGLSGVGKSSLLSAVQPGLNLRVGVVSDHSGEGRHTTTQATLLPLDSQTWVVDTPGIREFGLSGLTRSQLAPYFAELAEAATHCRFRNCAHLDEPDCAVQAAVARGAIAHSRYHSYRLIYTSLPA
jgi:ribosome biogenesis GTPase